jgi:hypothetical protein
MLEREEAFSLTFKDTINSDLKKLDVGVVAGFIWLMVATVFWLL